LYDTLDHQIGGFGQQPSYGGSLSFNSRYGLIDVEAGDEPPTTNRQATRARCERNLSGRLSPPKGSSKFWLT
jgi:hypothetical protein